MKETHASTAWMDVIPAIKRSSFFMSKRIGLMSLVAGSAWRRHRLLVLCYHGVSMADEHEWHPGLYVSPRTLARRFAALEHTGCDVLPLDEAVQRLYAGTLPARAVALTFDDGFHDFKARAFPMLQAHGFPATVYLATQRCEKNFPVPHLIASYLLWKHRTSILDANGIAGLDQRYPLAAEGDRQRVLADMQARMRADRMRPHAKDIFAGEVVRRLGVDYEAVKASRILRLMTPDEVADLSRQGIAMEMHTHRHRTPDDPDQFLAEVRLNRERLEAITGRRPQHFCYPSGVYHASYLPKLESEKIVTATTCDPGLASRAAHRLLLPRFVDTEHVSDIEFEAWITGAASWMPRRTHHAHSVH